jgi:outer membrane protein OmpA-like peptidoglycan-associated protein
LTLFGALAIACGGGASEQPPPAQPPAPTATAAPEPPPPMPATHADITAEGIRIGASEDGRPLAGVPVEVRFVSGAKLPATTDETGHATVQPDTTVLFDNAESPFAQVSVGDTLLKVDLRPLLAQAQATAPEAWKAHEGSRAAAAQKSDAAVSFAGTIYHDNAADAFVEVCLPSGAEICNDGIDNDCNGRYDETGCGYSSGSLQWTVTWRGAADLDLHVVGPDGVDVSADQRHSDATGLTLDRACTGAPHDCVDGKVENVFVPASQTPVTGTYMATVEVRGLDAARASEPIHVRFSGRIGSRTWYAPVSLAPMVGTEYRVAFPVGGDTDRDLVTDEFDACPDVQGCYFEDRTYRGCPDTDKDYVPDKIDACPKRAGLTDANPKANGCPKVFGAAWVTNAGVEIHKRVEFEFGKADLKPPSKVLLARVAEAIKKQGDAIKLLAVDGHTDWVGDEVSNLTLSRLRAEAVRNELAKDGVPLEQLRPRGFGETRPIADNATAKGRQENRRVEFVVLEPRANPSVCLF